MQIMNFTYLYIQATIIINNNAKIFMCQKGEQINFHEFILYY